MNVQSVLLVDNLKGYIVIEAEDPQIMFNAIQVIRQVKAQLRGSGAGQNLELEITDLAIGSKLVIVENFGSQSVKISKPLNVCGD